MPALVEPGVPGELAGRLIAKVPIRRVRGEGFLTPGDWVPFLRVEDQEVGLRFKMGMRRGGRVEIRESAAARPSGPWYPVLKRLARRIPGARGTARMIRTVQRRYAPS
ncbi:hypothetical protein ACFQX6_50085 [Streptosporangium lutulentum]